MDKANTQALEVDLSSYIPEGITSLNTRILGFILRTESKLDEQEAEDENRRIILKVPQQITSLNTAFLEELLENIVYKHRNKGAQKILAKIDLKSEARFNFRPYLENAIKGVYTKESV